MSYTDIYPMKRGNVLVTVNGYFGEEDFYLMHQVICDELQPEDAGYSVDSMCIGGYMKKDGILLKTSSECPYDTCCFFYDASSLNDEETETVKKWIDTVVSKMHELKEV